MKKNYLSLVLLCLIVSVSFVFGQSNEPSSNYEALINDYLKNNQSKFGLQSEDYADLVINNEYFSVGTEITHVYINQAYQNIRISNAISGVAIKNGEVFYFSNRFFKDISNKINTSTASQTPASAIEGLANHFQLGTPQNLVQLSKDGNAYTFSNGNISTRDISAELVYVNVEDQLKLAWDVIIYANDNTHWYSARIDATTNEIIEVDNLVLSCNFERPHTHEKMSESIDFFNKVNVPSPSILVDGSRYNVFALPAESPNHGPRQVVTDPASILASPFGWHDDDGVLGADHTITRGNNVWAQEDRDGLPFTVGFSPDGTSALNFDFPLDINQPPAGYEDVSITNLFYTNNMMHDIWYHYGFDEAAGNFQETNYTTLGASGDYVNADAQDGSGQNNATFGTPPDGQNPNMTMFLWTPAGPLNEPLTINNGTVAGDYNGSEATFGDALSTTPITSNLTLAIDGTPDANDACETLINTGALNGSIAVIRRGTCEFGFKVRAVENAGAIAAIIVNNEAGATITMGPGAVGNQVTIPSIMVNQSDGEAIISALIGGQTLSATLVNNGPFDIDGDFDNGIVAHEYGHGISTRLTGGPAAAGCLFNEEQMGEGWSDWFGLMVTMYPTDTEDDARGIGTFAVSQPTTGGGIRPARYSPDFAVNNFTYGDTNNPGLSVPHGVGFVWATVLWDLTWAYVDKYGFDPDLYNGNGGNNKVMQLVLDGLKLQPCEPGFIDGRDALLAADTAMGGADQCMIWEVFARRGLGFNASQGLSTSRSDQVEDFSMPPNSDASLANCTSLSVEEFSANTLQVYPNPTNDKISISTKTGLGNVTIKLTDLNGRAVLTIKKELFDTVSISTGNLQDGIYILSITGENFNFVEKIVKN
ncbi:T9SS-dependent M36 family metallopeptidase [Winogradskyella ouciana]|uniref:T9SS type A sorting domain-containing protein n=1 Tax=Winogradskyella ouciana TaxID=2608631 RepID=A0A7K1GC91_9FLAO|nr:T9SS-dependent M36 family metallopeptidase [Winogradskyella ouciana]MTE26912.1 T9SS type A sorting domain-containing protein [Winogradskyella ouciana]